MNATTNSSAKPEATFPKQAVVIIHGMGEQRPMDTIKGFVRTVWEFDVGLTNTSLPEQAAVWSKPDPRTGSLELRRITTRQSVATKIFATGVRTDFYELYWADLSGGSTWSEVEDWIAGLLFRNPFRNVPANIFAAWVLLWIASLLVALLALAAAVQASAPTLLNYWPLHWLSGIPASLLALATAVGGWIVYRFLVPYFGRVVRYTRANPENIAARQAIRKRGLTLLNALHSHEYDRIIVVGHSLGSILAYDLISFFWGIRLEPRTLVEGSAEFTALLALDAAASEIEKAASAGASEVKLAGLRKAYFDKQRAFGEALRARSKPRQGEADARWLITDLVTVGSPLTHASFLIAKTERDLRRRQQEREFPVCPPVREELIEDAIAKAKAAKFNVGADEKPGLFCFPFGSHKQWQLHHAAPFAAVRWTNIYDPAAAIFLGDIISGPVSPAFGPAIDDVNLKDRRRRQSFWFSHLWYWRQQKKNRPTVEAIALREAIDLGAQRF